MKTHADGQTQNVQAHVDVGLVRAVRKVEARLQHTLANKQHPGTLRVALEGLSNSLVLRQGQRGYKQYPTERRHSGV